MKYSLLDVLKKIFSPDIAQLETGERIEKSNNRNSRKSKQRLSKDSVAYHQKDPAVQNRYLPLLQYWLDFELSDLPECPKQSRPARDFPIFKREYLDDKKSVKNKSLMVMLQCHRAGYLLEGEPPDPNFITPRTYIVAFVLRPNWVEKEDQLRWSLSEDESDLIINLAILRTIFRKCHSPKQSGHSLLTWIVERTTNLADVIHREFTERETGVVSTEFGDIFKKLNRDVASEVWATKEQKEFVKKRTTTIENENLPAEDRFVEKEEDDKPVLTFQWRCALYDGLIPQQFSPFFATTLMQMIEALSVDQGAKRVLSIVTKQYLSPPPQQFQLARAIDNPKQYSDFLGVRQMPLGRWPDSLGFGLSLMQHVAMTLANQQQPILAVNGPPGTGKTMFLRHLVADSFVRRTELLLDEFKPEPGWYDYENPRTFLSILDNSIVVCSSNNNAVENVSKEIPTLSGIGKEFAASLEYFKALANPDEWGIFCAVLGNAENRAEFKKTVSRLQDHLGELNDLFQFNYFCNTAKKYWGQPQFSGAIERFPNRWKQQCEIPELIRTIESLSSTLTPKPQFIPRFINLLGQLLNSEKTTRDVVDWLSSFEQDAIELASEELSQLCQKMRRQNVSQKLLLSRFDQAMSDYKLARASLELVVDRMRHNDYSGTSLDPIDNLLKQSAFQRRSGEDENDAETRIQKSAPFSSEKLNRLRSELFVAAVRLNELIICMGGDGIRRGLDDITKLIDGRNPYPGSESKNAALWSLFFLIFPVASTTLASSGRQFSQMQGLEAIGRVLIDEAGQVANYHVLGMLQRAKQAIFVGDPKQLKPVVVTHELIDNNIAADFLPVDDEEWCQDYLVSQSSAQHIADKTGVWGAVLGDLRIGVPFWVHRRCNDPMFTIANQVSYQGRMVQATRPFDYAAIPSGWIHVQGNSFHGKYGNRDEASTAFALLKFLCLEHPEMAKRGVSIITPFREMAAQLRWQWNQCVKSPQDARWIEELLQDVGDMEIAAGKFRNYNIGTVHTFQGKEAGLVIICCGATGKNGGSGGISWVNANPNLLNVAVTRAQNHLFVIGNHKDWKDGRHSVHLQTDGMLLYDSIEQVYQALALPPAELRTLIRKRRKEDVVFPEF